jgi:hypothetical protein
VWHPFPTELPPLVVVVAYQANLAASVQQFSSTIQCFSKNKTKQNKKIYERVDGRYFWEYRIFIVCILFWLAATFSSVLLHDERKKIIKEL